MLRPYPATSRPSPRHSPVTNHEPLMTSRPSPQPWPASPDTTQRFAPGLPQSSPAAHSQEIPTPAKCPPANRGCRRRAAVVLGLKRLARDFSKFAEHSIERNTSPTPTLKTFPDTLGASHPSKFACTALSTYVKSRVCSPSPKTTGCVSSRNAVQNLASTPEYGELGSCLGPKMLK